MSDYQSQRRCEVCGCISVWQPTCDACKVAQLYEAKLEAAHERVAKLEAVLEAAQRLLEQGTPGEDACAYCGDFPDDTHSKECPLMQLDKVFVAATTGWQKSEGEG